MAKINSRSKGKRGELEWRDVLRAHGIHARRGAQFQGGTESPDVVSEDMPGWHVEVKRNECLQLYPALEQAIRDSAGVKTPYVAHRRNGKQWVVILEAEAFLAMITQSGMLAGLSPTSSPAVAPVSPSPSKDRTAATTAGAQPVATQPTRASLTDPTDAPSESSSVRTATSSSTGATGSARRARKPRSSTPGSATPAPHAAPPTGKTIKS